MMDENKMQAQKHIEKVVEKYRGDEGRDNFRWVVKPTFVIPVSGYGIGIVLVFVFLFGIGF
ncbi:TPA: hypothetical protein O8U08_004369, partial [Enterobacter cloacae]|nr:hypothetical protein [Enterobacter cloacae]